MVGEDRKIGSSTKKKKVSRCKVKNLNSRKRGINIKSRHMCTGIGMALVWYGMKKEKKKKERKKKKKK